MYIFKEKSIVYAAEDGCLFKRAFNLRFVLSLFSCLVIYRLGRPGLKSFTGQRFLLRSTRCTAGRGPCSAVTLLYFQQQHNWSCNSYFHANPHPLQKWQQLESDPLPHQPRALLSRAAALATCVLAVQLRNLTTCCSTAPCGSKGDQRSRIRQQHCFPGSAFDRVRLGGEQSSTLLNHPEPENCSRCYQILVASTHQPTECP